MPNPKKRHSNQFFGIKRLESLYDAVAESNAAVRCIKLSSIIYPHEKGFSYGYRFDYCRT